MTKDIEIKENTLEEIAKIMLQSSIAFDAYQLTTTKRRALFLEEIALEIEDLGDFLINTASEETNLPYQRLKIERDRTIFQLRTYKKMLQEGSYVEASIDTADLNRQPIAKPDIRKMLIPIGPVVVFGASNFPFAYSTAGGDTASALAVGCTVVVKAHPAHPKTSQLVANCIIKAAGKCNIPKNVFQHIHNSTFEAGKLLVQHDATNAVGFTGSFNGGKALLAYANARKNPIPVFAEMGSINPVVFLPNILKNNYSQLATQYAQSITASMGQFCTNPGLLLAIESDSLDNFLIDLATKLNEINPDKMLHKGILNAFHQLRSEASKQIGLEILTHNKDLDKEFACATLAKISAEIFINNLQLHEEVFGPYSLMVVCKNEKELITVLKILKGQLTTTINGNDEDLNNFSYLLQVSSQICGRVIFNGVPTGVEVCESMVHGGPFPATSDSRFTAVGKLAAKRWLRPICFQNCPQILLPEALKDENPLGIFRSINSQWTESSIIQEFK